MIVLPEPQNTKKLPFTHERVKICSLQAVYSIYYLVFRYYIGLEHKIPRIKSVYMDTKKIAVLGASGYTGAELLRGLLEHPNVEVTHVTADRHAGRAVSDVFPHLKGLIDLELVKLSASTVPDNIDIVFAALPHGASGEVIAELYKRELKIIDLGADFRLSLDNYKIWYGEHPCPELIDEAVYGITELSRDEIADAKLVANPGCYPTSAILGLAPLLSDGLIEEDSIIIDSKSGVSGAGRSPSLDYHFSEVNEGLRAYKIGEHRHTPEIEEALSNHSGLDVGITFTPHLIPMDRGILSTIYARMKDTRSTGEMLSLYKSFYSGEAFVRVSDEGAYPSTSQVKGSNFTDIGVKVNTEAGIAVIVSVLDNLVKGASGQAIQNMNIMMGWEETTGISNAPMFP